MRNAPLPSLTAAPALWKPSLHSILQVCSARLILEDANLVLLAQKQRGRQVQLLVHGAVERCC